MISKNKLLLILIIVFSAICIAFATTLIVSSVKLDYANDHYDQTEIIHEAFFSPEYSTFGCGEKDCQYCNGRSQQENLTDFVYYRTYNNLKISSIVILSTFGVLLVSSCIYLVVSNKKAINKE